MALYSLDAEDYIDEIPHKHDYDAWRSRLSTEEYDAIMLDLANRIQDDEILTSSWIPGADWSDTPFEAIYRNACGRSSDAARKFFGLLVWESFLKDDDAWSFGRYEKDGLPIEGLTYFRLKNAPPRKTRR